MPETKPPSKPKPKLTALGMPYIDQLLIAREYLQRRLTAVQATETAMSVYGPATPHMEAVFLQASFRRQLLENELKHLNHDLASSSRRIAAQRGGEPIQQVTA